MSSSERSWRPAPVWQSGIDGAVVALIPVLLLGPSSLGFTFGTRLIGWFGLAALIGGYGYLANRIRPVNPPTGSIQPRRVWIYGGALAVCLLLVLLGAVLADRWWWVVGAMVLAVVVTVIVSQWFERGVESEVLAQGLERGAHRQQRNVVREARRKAHGLDAEATWHREERASERWAREQRERREAGAADAAVEAPRGLELALPQRDPAADEREVRTVYRPTDRRASTNPNRRKRKRRR